MNDIDRAELRRLDAAATPGPWKAERIHHRPHSQPPHWCWEVTQDGQALFDCIREDELDAAETAEFIAAYRTAVPALLDALEQAEARIQAVRELHVRDDDPGTCYGCYSTWPGYTEEHPEWPCATIRALDA